MENRLHWCMDVVFADDQMRILTGHAANNLAVLKHITLEPICLDPAKRKGGIKARRLLAAASDPIALSYSAWLNVHALALSLARRRREAACYSFAA